MVDFFVIGSARSGTTLLRTVLIGSPDIAIPGETYFTVPLLKKARDITVADAWRVMRSSASLEQWRLDPDLMQRVWQRSAPRTVPEAIAAVYRAYAEAQGARLVGDKTPYHCRSVPLLAEAFPEAKFVIISRDGRDVARSLQKTYFGGRSFATNALDWSQDVTAVDRAVAALDRERVHQLRFEELTSDPASTVAALCTFLGATADPAMVHPELRGSDVLDSMRRNEHLQNIATPILARPVTQLPARQEWLFRSIAGDADDLLAHDGPRSPRTVPQRYAARVVRAGAQTRGIGAGVQRRVGRAVGRRPVDRYPTTPTVPPAHGRTGGVVALVLTHGAPDALARCLDALQAQTRRPDEVIVLDNLGSPPAAPDAREGLPVTVLRSSANTGPAGGWAELIRCGSESGAEWLWLLDDDVTAAPDCLERLLAHAASEGLHTVQPRALEESTGEWRTYPAWLGPLLHRSILDQVGLPRAELVWWAEDSEYLQIRLRECGFALSVAPDATVRHSMVRRTSVPRWKRYYETRNSVWIRVRARQQYASRPHLRRLAHALTGQVVGAVRGPEPVADVLAVAWGLAHGLSALDRRPPAFVVGGSAPAFSPSHTVVTVESATHRDDQPSKS